MWYRAGAVLEWGKGASALPRLVACVAACVLACGDDASTPASAMESTSPSQSDSSQPEPTPASADLPSELPESTAAFRLSIDGWAEQLGAKAQLNVTEGERAVRLEITGTGQIDVLFLDLDFDGVEGSMGSHRVDLGLPGDAIDSAIASLGGQTYHSQTGHIEVTLAADGSIAGRFDVALALDPDFAPGDPIKFELSDEVRPLSGDFAGTWDLFCQSHLPGHSGAYMKGGDYCDGIAFE
jgi:hypothetical protein